MKQRFALLFAISPVFFSSNAYALVKYSYSGRPLQVFSGNPGSACPFKAVFPFLFNACKLSVYFLVPVRLPANVSNQEIHPISFSFTDDIQTITKPYNSNSDNLHFNVSTDSTGDVTSWDIRIAGSVLVRKGEKASSAPYIATCNEPYTTCPSLGSVIDYSQGINFLYTLYNTNQPGTCTVSSEIKPR
jgi:hypothetical protein